MDQLIKNQEMVSLRMEGNLSILALDLPVSADGMELGFALVSIIIQCQDGQRRRWR